MIAPDPLPPLALEPGPTVELGAETWSTPAAWGGTLVAADRSGRVTAAGADGATRWTVETGEEITASPVVARLGGEPAVLVGTHGGTLLALGLDGGVRWRRHAGAMVRASASVAEIAGRTAVVWAAYGPRVLCLTPDGQERWSARLPAHGVYHRGRDAGAVSTPMLADIDGDGRVEVVLGTRTSRVVCLDGRTGALRWFRTLTSDPDSSPSLAVGDGRAAVLVGGGEHTGGTGDRALVALDPADGRELWRAPAGAGVDSAPLVADLDGDGRPEAAFTTLGSGAVVAVDARTGALRWRAPLGPTDACLHDPACRRPGAPYVTGKAVCRSYVSPLAADLDADGRLELVAGSNNGRLVVLDAATGAERARVETGGMVRGSPVLADLDESGVCTLAVPSGRRVLTFGTRAPTAQAWPQFKGDAAHAGQRRPRSAPLAAGDPPWAVRSRLWWSAGPRDAARWAAVQAHRRLGLPLLARPY